MNKPSSKIISVFDTTFGKDAVLKINDMEKFLEGILNILNESSELSVVFKKKFNWNEMIENHQGEEIISIYEKLKSHNRCYFLEDNSESAEAIAASDLVISACFTSCTVEALGAGKKAMFFDGAGNLRNYHYDKFPKMVAHGYDELKDFVNFWLYEINEEDFRKYLNEQVKSDLDPFVDGKAITRFRKLLSE